MPVSVKKCKTCGKWKPAYEFCLVRDGQTVRTAECKPCIIRQSIAENRRDKARRQLWNGK